MFVNSVQLNFELNLMKPGGHMRPRLPSSKLKDETNWLCCAASSQCAYSEPGTLGSTRSSLFPALSGCIHFMPIVFCMNLASTLVLVRPKLVSDPPTYLQIPLLYKMDSLGSQKCHLFRLDQPHSK